MRQGVSGRVARTLDALGPLPRLLTSEQPLVHGDTVAVPLGHGFWVDITLQDGGEFRLERYLAPRPFVRVYAGDLDGVQLMDLREAVEWLGFWPFTMGD
jgi:hypothetical protein